MTRTDAGNYEEVVSYFQCFWVIERENYHHYSDTENGWTRPSTTFQLLQNFSALFPEAELGQKNIYIILKTTTKNSFSANNILGHLYFKKT